MTNTTKENLINMSEFIENELIENIDNGTLYDYICECLDIEFISDARREFLGARILVTFGGPNIWINTRKGHIEAYWGNENFYFHLDSYVVNELNNVLEELYFC